MLKKWITLFFVTPHSRINPYDVENEFTLKKDFPNK
ncbi:hypothetical protein OG9_04318 [Enterococcus faecium EnGen0005]|nr:hypothetical protein OG9_04318 [Enterococcus faecium EnGen0005]